MKSIHAVFDIIARAAPATAGLAIAADAQFPVDFFLLGTQTSKGEHAEGVQEDGPEVQLYHTTYCGLSKG